MKNLEKRKVRSHNKVRAFLPKKVRFARAEQLWFGMRNSREQCPTAVCAISRTRGD